LGTAASSLLTWRISLAGPAHPRISYFRGSSIDPAIVTQVRDEVKDSRALVILESDHRLEHVYDEMLCYSPLVQVGDYLIVEDTNINGHPTFLEYGPGPMEAVNAFLSSTKDFVVDHRCERFLMTLNPRGYLRRIAKAGHSRGILNHSLEPQGYPPESL